jgi:hypothetical protein
MARSHGFAGATVVVEGLDRLVRDFNRLDPELRRGVQREMDKIGKIVADDAKADVTQRGLVVSGDMRRGIRQRVRGGSVVVRSSAAHRGYNYPKIFEFGGRSASLRRDGSGKTTQVSRRSSIGANLAASGAAMGEYGEYGPQAILLPALIRNAENVTNALEDMFDRITSQNGFHPGGIL